MYSRTTPEGGALTCESTITVVGNSSVCDDLNTDSPTAPTALCEDITVALDSLGMASIDASDIDNGSFNFETLSVSPNTFTCESLRTLNFGTNPVTLTATNAMGEISTCAALVQIEEFDSNPVCQDFIAELNEDGVFLLFPSDIGGPGLNCGNDLLSFRGDFDPNRTLRCDEIGEVLVDLLVRSGPGSLCTSTVTVVDNIGPTAMCAPFTTCLLYTSPSPRDATLSRMPSSA